MTLAVSATASVATPVQPSSLTAVNIGLACLAAVLISGAALFYVIRLLRRNPPPAPAVPTDAAAVIHSARDAIFVIAESGEILSTNPAAEKLFGYPFSEWNGMNIAAIIPPPASGKNRAIYIRASEGLELVGVRKNGDRFPLDLVLSELPGHDSKRFSVIVRDRSDQNRLEEELESHRQFAASILDHLPSLLVVIDQAGRIIRFNRTCEALTGYAEDELRGQLIWRVLYAPSESGRAEANVRRILNGDFPARSQSVWMLRDNSTRTIDWVHSALFDERGRLAHVVSTGLDVTDALQSEDRRREADTLHAAGRLAGGIAHDFNNLLTAITGYSGLALVNLDPRDPVRNDIEEIKRASDHGAEITRQLLTFSGNRPGNAEHLDLNAAVRNVERLVRLMTGENIHLDLSLEKDLPLVLADRQALEECIMHLVANAKEAMPHGGTVQIQTGVRTLNRTRLDARPPIGPGEFVTLSVVDTGSGVPPEALPHIFEPFYTTKETPASNGMGLAMVYGMVRRAEGSIIVHSAPKYGSTFRIFLPLAPDQVLRQKTEPLSEDSLQGEETVLLAMESDVERQRLRDVMESAGYTVLDARSGLQALEIAHKATRIIHLLLTDIVLPRLPGPALVESVLARLPAIRVLYATSRSTEEISRHGLRAEDVLRLDRTLDRRFLLLRIRESLSAESRP